MNFTGKLLRWRLRLSDVGSDVLHYANTTHRAAGALSHLNYRTYQAAIDDKIPVLCLTAYIHQKMRVGGYVWARLQRTKRKITHRATRRIRYRNVHGNQIGQTFDYSTRFWIRAAEKLVLWPSSNYSRISGIDVWLQQEWFWFVLQPPIGKYKMSSLHLYSYVCCINRNIQHWWDTRVKRHVHSM